MRFRLFGYEVSVVKRPLTVKHSMLEQIQRLVDNYERVIGYRPVCVVMSLEDRAEYVTELIEDRRYIKFDSVDNTVELDGRLALFVDGNAKSGEFFVLSEYLSDIRRRKA